MCVTSCFNTSAWGCAIMQCICRGLLNDMCMPRQADVLGHEVRQYIYIYVYIYIYAYACMFICICQCTCLYKEILWVFMSIYMKDVPIPWVSHERRKMAPLKDVRILVDLFERRRIVLKKEILIFSFFSLVSTSFRQISDNSHVFQEGHTASFTQISRNRHVFHGGEYTS